MHISGVKNQQITRFKTSTQQWCGQKPLVLGQDQSETKKSVLVFQAVVLVLHTVVLVLQFWCCFVKHDLVHFRWSWSCHFGLGLGLVSSGLGLVTLVLVLRIWSCLHHWYTVSSIFKLYFATITNIQMDMTIDNKTKLFSNSSQRTDSGIIVQ